MGNIIGFGTLENEKERLIQATQNYRSDIKEQVVKEIEKNYEIIKRYFVKLGNIGNIGPESYMNFERKRLNSLIREYAHEMRTSSDRVLEKFFPNDERVDDIDAIYMDHRRLD
jgi:hypothetical protein